MLIPRSPGTHSPHKYRQLFIVLIVVFLLSPFFRYGIGALLLDLLFFLTIVLLIRSFMISERLLRLYITIAMLALCLKFSISLGQPTDANLVINLFSHIILVLYIGGATCLISRDVFMAPRITVDTVQGGISVYLLIGFGWALLYGMVSAIEPAAFSQPLLLGESYLRMFHFSFTTLTALGYGDIVPVSEIALVLSNLEAITGQMYPAVLISFLMGGYLANRTY